MINDYKEIGSYFLDADLSILGEDREVYESYAARIRQEYKHVPNEVYLVKRP
jgi:predicted metal-dependent HD superfamily phosphohydrolase